MRHKITKDIIDENDQRDIHRTHYTTAVEKIHGTCFKKDYVLGHKNSQ